ncbi:MAG TPA: monooxygenase [Acidimicrobiia bacterium]|nr:monooxygenase [Acidimicrobiia bacterium]
MSIAGSRVGIVGGSIAGCAMAVAAWRLGCDVTVFEASSGDLEDRGAGIFIPLPLRHELVVSGYLAPDAPYCHPPERLWVTADPEEPTGRVMWRHDFPGAAHNWGVLWRGLRSLVPAAAYRKGSVVACQPEPDEVTVILDDGSTERFDVLVGADGYRSSVRRAVRPDVRPAYAGYVLWRGNYDEHRLANPAVAAILDQGFVTVCFPGGHAIIYLIPGRNGRTGPGERRIIWALYGSPPPGMDFTEPLSIPPGDVPRALADRLEEILDRHLPSAWTDLVRTGGPDVLSVQPIYDHAVPAFVTGRVVLVGDAATLSRPHTAGGVTKAMQEALAFEAAGSTHGSWPQLLAAFDAARCPVATEIVEASRLLGHGLVEHTPDWTAMSEQQAEQFIAGTIAGRNLYMQPSAP